MHIEAYLNVHRDMKEHPTPYSFTKPWDKPETPVTDDERDKLVASLERRSALRGR